MGVFQSSRTYPTLLRDGASVARELVRHFEGKGFEAAARSTVTGGQYVSISKGGLFKAVLGMKTALNIEIEPTAAGTFVKAGIGIFGQQVVPALIVPFFWPIILTQMTGVVEQAGLDDEALGVVERSLASHGGPATQPQAAFCTSCGSRLDPAAKFCSACGSKVA
jgi:hypothetical protein